MSADKIEIKFAADLTGDQLSQLAEIFGCPEKEVPSALAKCGRAALDEYLGMFLGDKVFTRGSDVLAYRLLLLIQSYFGDVVPNDSQVSRLFQTSGNQSRALIRSVMSKYQHRIKPARDASIKAVLAQAKPLKDTSDQITVVIDSANIVEAMNERLAELDGTKPKVERAGPAVSSYKIFLSSYCALCKALNVKAAKGIKC